LEFWELFRGYECVRALKGGASCGLLIVVLKEEIKGKKLESRISLSLSSFLSFSSILLSLLSFFLSYLVMG